VDTSVQRPISITILVCLLLIYAILIIGWDMVMPFERPYAQGPATVVFGLRVFGWSAQIMHALQLLVALLLAHGLWRMKRWGFQLIFLIVAYILISTTVWVTVYKEFGRIVFAFLNIVIVNVLLGLTFPHREKFE
jgi:hypothetical protein